MKHKVVIFGTQWFENDTFIRANETRNFELIFRSEHLTVDNVFLAQGANAVCISADTFVNSELVNKLLDLDIHIIALRSAGFNNVDLEAVKGKLKVVRVPAYSPNAIAEHAVGLMLSLNRKIHRAYWRTKDDNFSIRGFLGFNMQGRTVGVIGTGKIGKVVSRLLKGFDMNVLCYDVYPDKNFADQLGVKYASLDELYSQSDIITLHCPLTAQNEFMINKESLSKMKNGVMIINTGRGKLVHSQDLVDALISGKVGYAGLDVYEEEERYFTRDLSDQVMKDNVLARLLSFNNVIVTSHQAYFTKEAINNIAEITLQNICDFFENKELANEVKG